MSAWLSRGGFLCGSTDGPEGSSPRRTKSSAPSPGWSTKTCCTMRRSPEMEHQTMQPDSPVLECVYSRPGTLTETRFHYCPGCGHGVVHRVLMEAVEEL